MNIKALKSPRLFLILATVFAFAGIVTLCFGVFGVMRQGPKQVEPTLRTTAIVSHKEITLDPDRGEPESWRRNYWVYLDFSGSSMEPTLIWALTEEQQGILLRNKNDFNKFNVGQQVTVVYYTAESVWETVCIESVDGCEPLMGSGDLTTPNLEHSWNIILIIVGGVMLVQSVCFSFIYRDKRRQ